MRIIEAGAYRSWSIKVPKEDWTGEERFRPHEEVQFHASFKASIETTDDAEAAQAKLQDACEESVEGRVAAFRLRQLHPLGRATVPYVPKPTAAPQAAPGPSYSMPPTQAPAPAAQPSLVRPSVQQKQYLLDLVMKGEAAGLDMKVFRDHPPATLAAADMAIKEAREALRVKGVRA